jgi:hypothetical protein
VHWAWSDAPLDRAAQDKLAALLTYGDPAPASQPAATWSW